MSDIGSIGWFELHTSRRDAAAAFYRDVAGWRTEVEESSGDLSAFPAGEEDPVAGIIETDDSLAIWVPFLVVESVEEALARAEAHGAKQLGQTTTQAEYGTWTLIEDPFGAKLCLFEHSEEE